MKKALCILFCLGCLNVMNAQVISGEITYAADTTQAFTYNIKVSLLTWSDTTDSICLDKIELDFDGGGWDTILNNTLGLDSCGQLLGNMGCGKKLYLNEFTVNHTYPDTGSYRLSVEIVSRTEGMLNIPNSMFVPFSLYSDLVIDTLLGDNTSVELQSLPYENGNIDSCLNHDPNVNVTDGDSISYSLMPCLGSGQIPIPGYAFPDEILPGPNNNFTFDSLTGYITWCSPQMQGTYSVCMLIEEYSDSVFRGSVFREILFCIDQAPVLINESEQNEHIINIYPNPASNEINVAINSMQSATFELYDITGRKVLSQNITSNQPINISALAKGLYVWHLSAGQAELGTARGKVVISN